MKKTYIVLGLIFSLLLLAGGTVKAVNVYYQANRSNGAASTTATYARQSTATSTNMQTFSSDGYSRVSYLVALGASTTPPTLCWSTDYSDNGVDWYADNIALNANATSTVNVRTFKEDCWVYATTTDQSTYVSKGSTGDTIFLGKKIDVTGLSTGLARTRFYITSAAGALLDVRRIVSNEVILTK